MQLMFDRQPGKLVPQRPQSDAMFIGIPSGSFSVSGLCTLQQPYTFQSNSLFMRNSVAFLAVAVTALMLRLWVSLLLAVPLPLA